MSKILPVLMFLACGLILAGCNSNDKKVASTQNSQPTGQVETINADGVRRITIQELQQMRTDNSAFIVDVRNQAAYDQGHIPGSKLIPSNEILNHVNELPRDKTIVTYCS